MEYSIMERYEFHSIPSLITLFFPLRFGQNKQLTLFCPKIFKQLNDIFVPLCFIPLHSTLLCSIRLHSFHNIQTQPKDMFGLVEWDGMERNGVVNNEIPLFRFANNVQNGMEHGGICYILFHPILHLLFHLIWDVCNGMKNF